MWGTKIECIVTFFFVLNICRKDCMTLIPKKAQRFFVRHLNYSAYDNIYEPQLSLIYIP